MDRPNKELRPIALRFSLRHLLLAMTIASVLMGLLTLLPTEVMQILAPLVDIGLVAALVSGVMSCSGRSRIACVAALVPLAIAAFGKPILGGLYGGCRPLFYMFSTHTLTATFASRWAEVLLSGAVAYAVAGWLESAKEAE